MTEAEREQRRYALAISGGVCEVCGAPLNDGQPQGARGNKYVIDDNGYEQLVFDF